jgi:hypothetical protein
MEISAYVNFPERVSAYVIRLKKILLVKLTTMQFPQCIGDSWLYVYCMDVVKLPGNSQEISQRLSGVCATTIKKSWFQAKRGPVHPKTV